MARGAELVDRLRDLAFAFERGFGDVGIEPHVEPRERRVDPAEDPCGGRPAYRGEPLLIGQLRPSRLLGGEVATEVIDVCAVIAVLGDPRRTSEVAQVAGVHRRPEPVHLTPGVVVVVLALHAPPRGIEQPRDRVAEHRVPGVPDVQRAGRVRAHELDLDAPLRPRRGSVRCPLGRDPAQDVVQPPLGDEHVDEARTGDLDLPDERRGRQGRDDRLGDRARGRRDPGRHRERDVGGEVSVLLLPRLHHVGLGKVSVQPEAGRRGLEARPEPSPELVLDHVPAAWIEPRTVSIRAAVSKGLVMYRTPGATGVVSSARAVRNTTGIAPSCGSSRSL